MSTEKKEIPLVIRGLGDTRDDTWWKIPTREPGEDPLWDALGDDWQAIDEVHPGTRLYVRWEGEEGERPRVTGFCVAGPEITTDIIRKVPVTRLENLRQWATERMDSLAANSFENLEPLRRSKNLTPEQFAEQVAWHYKMFAAYSSSPTKDLAEHSGVPLSTMRSWIREARLRGKLPPGTPGKSG